MRAYAAGLLRDPAEAEDAARSDARPAKDHTGIPFVTIDPATSKDLDQAMHLSRTKSGFRVRYAIADVASYVRPNGPLEAETWVRGQTVYLPDGRIPLHQPVLSEGAVSLFPDVDRAAMETIRKLKMELKEVTLPDWPYSSLMPILFAEGAASFEELALNNELGSLKAQVRDAWPNLFREARFLSAVDFVQADRLRRKVAAEMARGAHDVYLVDYRLGRHTGLDLLRAAAAQGCRAPVILLTAHSDAEIVQRAIKLGVSAYIVKPVKRNQLEARIATVLDKMHGYS